MHVAGFPGITHVAVTVSDLERSRAFYGRLFSSDPVLDEDAGSFYHVVFALEDGTLFGLHTHPVPNDQPRFREHRSGLDHVAFGVSSGAGSRIGRAGWMRWASITAGSSMRRTVRASPSVTRTTSPWNSSRHRPDGTRGLRLRNVRLGEMVVGTAFRLTKRVSPLCRQVLQLALLP